MTAITRAAGTPSLRPLWIASRLTEALLVLVRSPGITVLRLTLGWLVLATAAF